MRHDLLPGKIELPRVSAKRSSGKVVRVGDDERIGGGGRGQSTNVWETEKGGRRMRRFTRVALGIAAILCLAGIAAAAESGTKDECVAKTKEAGKMVTDMGVEATIAEVNKKDGKFVWKDTYVFLMDLDGKMIAHPMSPALIGQNVLDKKDKGEPGKLLFVEMVEVAKGKGEGWVEYMWSNPGDPKPRKKVTYIYRVPGKNVFAAAGVYE